MVIVMDEMELKRNKTWVKHFDFIFIDFIVLQLSYLLANMIRYRTSTLSGLKYGARLSIYNNEVIFLTVCLIASITFGEPYKNVLKNSKYLELVRTFMHTVKMTMLNIAIIYFLQLGDDISRLVILITWGIYFVLEYIARQIHKTVLRKKLKHYGSKRAMIVYTSSSNIKRLMKNLVTKEYVGYFISAIFLSDYDGSINEVDGVKVLGNEDDMIEYASHNWVDSALVTTHDRKKNTYLRDLFDVMGITTHTIISTVDPHHNEYIQKVGNYIVSSNTYRSIPVGQKILKRAVDIVGGIVGCIATGIIILIVGPMIYMKSPGPIIFSQKRVGKNGKLFTMYKFRSMYMDAEDRKKELMKQNKISDGMMFKMEDDPRIIGSEKKDKNGKPKGIGNFIRNTSLDEFPQFFNVLKGDMSLVGTRPPTIDEWNKYSPHHRKRMAIRPGITGLWQVSGRSNITDFEEVVRLDSEYIDNWTISEDIHIIIKTFISVLAHEGAS